LINIKEKKKLFVQTGIDVRLIMMLLFWGEMDFILRDLRKGFVIIGLKLENVY